MGSNSSEALPAAGTVAFLPPKWQGILRHADAPIQSLIRRRLTRFSESLSRVRWDDRQPFLNHTASNGRKPVQQELVTVPGRVVIDLMDVDHALGL